MTRWIADFILTLRMPCRAHAELLTRRLDEPLPSSTMVALRIHTLYCRSCRLFGRQVANLKALTRTLHQREASAERLPEAVRARLQEACIRRAHEDPPSM